MLALWCFCALWLAPRLQQQLLQQARAAVANLPTGYSAAEVLAHGRQLIVRGDIRHREQLDQILRKLRHELRLGNSMARRLNPVSGVSNETRIMPYPNGWLMITAAGSRGQLWGATASEAERRDLSLALTQAWSQQGGNLDSRLRTDSAHHDEAADVAPTLEDLPLPTNQDPHQALAAVVTIGGSWKILSLDQPSERSRQLCLEAGVQASLWEEAIAPAMQRLRQYRSQQLALAAEARRQATLPPPHLFVAWRDKRLLVRGEVGDLEGKRQWLNALISAFPDIRIIDDVRLNPNRRRRIELPNLGPADLAARRPEHDDDPPEGRGVLLGVGGSGGWTRLQQLRLGTPGWAGTLPALLKPTALLADHRMVTEWLLEDSRGIPAMSSRSQPAFVQWLLLNDRVWIMGQVAEEASRAQLLDATKRAYAGRALVDSEGLLARGNCEPSPDLIHTLHSLPPLPKTGQLATLAFAQPGESLRFCSLQASWLESGALPQSNLFPNRFPAALAEHALLEHRTRLLQSLGQKTSLPAPAPSPANPTKP